MSLIVFNGTATTEIYTLSLHDALPICRDAARAPLGCRHGDPARRGGEARSRSRGRERRRDRLAGPTRVGHRDPPASLRSEEHTSELQSRHNLVCRLLLENKNSVVPPPE